MFVVLQQGNNTKGWSSNGYLNPSGSFKAAVDATCVYELVKVGEDAQGDDVFVLKTSPTSSTSTLRVTLCLMAKLSSAPS